MEAQDSISDEQIDDLTQEAEKIISDLSSSFPIPDSLEALKSEFNLIKKDWQNNKDSQQTFQNLQKLVIKLDALIDAQEWPKLEEDIRKALSELEKLVDECVSNQLQGYQSDKSDLETFKQHFEQVKTAKKQDLGQDLLNNINSKIYQIKDRHAGKEQTEAYIRSFNQHFSTINWKNPSVARSEVDKGMQMISMGSSESELKSQLSRIFNQMQDPSSGGPGGGIRG